MAENRQILLVKRPEGAPTADCFELVNNPIPALQDGQFLLQNHVISMDAGVRGFLDERSRYGDFAPSVALGAPVNGMTLGTVMESRHPEVRQGQIVRSMAHWEEYSVLDSAIGLEVVDPLPGVPLRHYMGILGPVGLTAWVGMRIIGNVQAGETVVVSAAAGATGSAASQIGKLLGARVIGLAGGPEKIKFLRALGLDDAVDYTAVDDIGESVLALAPEGANVFFDNVGAEVLDSMLPAMANHGRVVNCGMVSGYNDADNPYGVKSLWQLILKRLTLRGFLVFDHMDEIAIGQGELDNWYASGNLRIHETVYQGIAATPDAFIALLTRRTTGKVLVELN